MTNFKQIGDGLFIGPQPSGQDLVEAKQQGIHTVIDMRTPGETATSNAELVRNSGLDYFNVNRHHFPRYSAAVKNAAFQTRLATAVY